MLLTVLGLSLISIASAFIKRDTLNIDATLLIEPEVYKKANLPENLNDNLWESFPNLKLNVQQIENLSNGNSPKTECENIVQLDSFLTCYNDILSSDEKENSHVLPAIYNVLNRYIDGGEIQENTLRFVFVWSANKFNEDFYTKSTCENPNIVADKAISAHTRIIVFLPTETETTEFPKNINAVFSTSSEMNVLTHINTILNFVVTNFDGVKSDKMNINIYGEPLSLINSEQTTISTLENDLYKCISSDNETDKLNWDITLPENPPTHETDSAEIVTSVTPTNVLKLTFQDKYSVISGETYEVLAKQLNSTSGNFRTPSLTESTIKQTTVQAKSSKSSLPKTIVIVICSIVGILCLSLVSYYLFRMLKK